MKKLHKIIGSALTLVAVISMVTMLNTNVTNAAFNKNNLISDSLFTDTDSMSVAQIQSFLEDRGSLLANWRDNVEMRRPSDNCVVHHATGKTAAQIIWEAANQWGAQVYNSNGCAIAGKYWSDAAYSGYTLKTVSPKVLLVTLQKEQSLLTANGGYSTNPNAYKSPACCSSNEYKLARAMGYGVPDSGGINEKYLGFYNQINWAAWQLRYNFERSAGNTAWDEVGYLTYGGPMIKGTYRRCASCALQNFDGYYPIDGQSLYMANRATASLYYYTPHTYPGYFGNFNFVNFYEQWFGSTQAFQLTIPHPPGTLVRSTGDNTVYVIGSDNQRHSLSTLGIFLSYGYDHKNVKKATVGDQALPIGSPITKHREGTLLRGSDGVVYVIDNIGGVEHKRSIGSFQNFHDLGYSFGEVINIPDSQMPGSTGAVIADATEHPDGTLVRAEGENTVYYIEGGQRRSMTSYGVFISHGLRIDRVKTATAADNAMPIGPGINWRQGVLAKGSAPTVYVINYDSMGVNKKSLGSHSIFVGLGYKNEEVIKESDANLPVRTGATITP